MFEPSLDTEHAFGQAGGVSRTRVRWRRLTCIAMLALTVHLWVPLAARAVLHAPGGPPLVPARTYVVQPGDTLWAIAARVEPGADPRLVVEDLSRGNALEDGGLVPGQVIQFPAAA